MTNNIKTAILIDGHSILYRSYFVAKVKNENDRNALKDEIVSVFKFIINKLLNSKKYQYKVIAFDISRNTFRREKFPNYKKQRAAMPEELKENKPIIIKLLSKIGVHVVDAPKSFEADDVIATLSKQFTDCEIRTEICTTDKDLLQLVNYFTSVNLIKSHSEIENHNHNNFQKLNNGLLPYQIPFFKALAGDSSDNYKGVPGIGEKTALNLIKNYKNKKNMFNKLNEIPEKVKQKLIENEEKLNLYLEISKAVDDLKLNFSISDIYSQ